MDEYSLAVLLGAFITSILTVFAAIENYTVLSTIFAVTTSMLVLILAIAQKPASLFNERKSRK